MNKIAFSLVAFAASFAPAIALACPGYAANAGNASCGSAGAGYLSAIGLGVAIGIGSSALEGNFHKKN
jgi:hypothetical protein